jgi:hypothetical protein
LGRVFDAERLDLAPNPGANSPHGGVNASRGNEIRALVDGVSLAIDAGITRAWRVSRISDPISAKCRSHPR